MSRFHVVLPPQRLISIVFIGLLLFGVISPHFFGQATGIRLGNRVLNLSNNQVSGVGIYNLAFEITTPEVVGSISFQACANDPIPYNPCTAPTGFDFSHASLSAQSGSNDFTVNSSLSNANTIVMSHAPAAGVVGQQDSFNFTNVTNPSSPGSYYIRLKTFATSDATGEYSDYGGVVFSINNPISITATVPPYLIFCTGITITGLNCANAAGDYIDFGELSASHPNAATSQFLVATNAAQGYSISDDGTTMTSGNNVITALANGDVSRPGTSQYGFNLQSNVSPSDGQAVSGPGASQATTPYTQANSYRFAPGDTLVSNPGPDDLRLYTSSYVVNIPPTQPPGIYVSTITYICLANF